MDYEYSVVVNNIDRLLFQLVLHIQELSLKKNGINLHIKDCRAKSVEWRSYIETMQTNIRNLEEEIGNKQHTVTQTKANAKSMKAAHSLLLEYQHTLRAELQSSRDNYEQDMEVFKERIESCRKVFQSHKEYYWQSPLAKKLLMLQAEKKEIESRIEACDDQITMKQKELDRLAGLAVTSLVEELPDSVSGQQPAMEPEEKSLRDSKTEEESPPAIDINSLHLNHTENAQKTSEQVNGEEIHEENQVQCATICSPLPDEVSEPWSCNPLDEQRQPEEMHTDHKDLSSSQEPYTQSSPAETPVKPSTTMFPFSSLCQGATPPAFPGFRFSLNSGPSTPEFSGFGFDMGSSQKTTEPKSSASPEFLFGQPEQSEDFHFAFGFMSPQSANKDDPKDDFPFSFNF